MVKLNHKIKINLLEFFTKGKFDYLELGMSSEEVLNIFPEPEEKIAVQPKAGIFVWRYGNFELHFLAGCLEMIYNDYIDDIDGGAHLEVDQSIFAPGHEKDLGSVLSKLNRLGINYKKISPSSISVSVTALPGGATLGFGNEDMLLNTPGNGALDDHNTYVLNSIYKSAD